MPYEVRETNECPASKKWGLFKKSNNELLGCHETKEDAERHRRAIEKHTHEDAMKNYENNRAITGVKAKLINRLRLVDPRLANDISSIRLGWFKVVNTAETDAEAEKSTAVESADAEVFIYDEIGGSFGVDANELVMAINEITSDKINVRINSPGGSLFDSIAIYNALIKHPAFVTTYVDALAASAASLVAMAGDEVVMMPGSQMMIHDALGMEYGNEADLREMADFLGRQSENIANIYKARAGEDTDWRAAMLAETWLFAEEAVSIGLADRVVLPPKRRQELAAPEEEEEPETPGEEEPETPGEEEPEEEEVNELQDAYNKLHRRHPLTNRGFRHAGRQKAPAPLVTANKGYTDLYGRTN